MNVTLRRIAGSLAILGAGLLIAVILVNVIIYGETRPFLYESEAAVPYATVVLVPGAPLLATGVLSSVFTDRLDTARALYEAGKAQKILVSGDNSSVSHNEVNPAATYLVEHGVPAEDIFLDHAGFDTYSSMYRARDIFGVTSMIIASQSFHLPRAIFIARNLGIEAYGVSADRGHLLVRNYVREIFANEKAVFDLLFHVTPKYLGEPIPITGDGRAYP